MTKCRCAASITTTVQGGMSGDVRRAARRLAWERLARSLHSCVSSSHRSSSFGPNRSRGSISRTTRYTWGRVIRGIFFPPILLQTQEERLQPAGIGPRGGASPARSGSRTRPVPCRSSPSRTPFQCATWNRPRRPESPRECPRERWTDSSGARCRPGSGGRWPSGFRRASACWLAAPAGR